jgi:hypothetical protein
MTDEEIAQGLQTLSYGRRWVDYGFLDPEELRQQMLIFGTGEDRETGHYRYAAFCRVLERESLSNEEIDRYLELVVEDPDPSMADSVRHMLVWWPKLTPDQRLRLRAHPDFTEGRLQRQFVLRDLSDQLVTPTISDKFFDQCLATGDETLQRQIVEHPGVTRRQLERLIETGKSKAVRNMASAKMRRMDAHTSTGAV